MLFFTLEAYIQERFETNRRTHSPYYTSISPTPTPHTQKKDRDLQSLPRNKIKKKKVGPTQSPRILKKISSSYKTCKVCVYRLTSQVLSTFGLDPRFSYPFSYFQSLCPTHSESLRLRNKKLYPLSRHMTSVSRVGDVGLPKY